MKELKQKALKKLENNQIIENLNYKDSCQTAISLSKNNTDKETIKNILLNNTKKQNKNNQLIENNSPILLFKSISKYLHNLNNLNIYNQNNQENQNTNNNYNIKSEIKPFIKFIKNTIKYLENHFDNHYLLIFENINNQTTYSTLENAYLLNCLEEMSDILNNIKYNKQADYLLMLKNKIELGFSRYLYNKKHNIIIKEFDNNKNIKFANNIELLEILNEYLPDKNLLKIKHNNKNIIEKLLYLKLLKQKNKTSTTKELNNIKSILEYFPEYITTRKEFEKIKDINKSINKEFKINHKKQKDTNNILVNTNSIKTINLILSI